MSTGKKIRMEEIAKLANVSRATVSRALKNSPLINEQTRERVQRIAREHNYSVDAAARNFRLKKTHTIAVVLLVDKEWGHEVSDAFLLVLLGAIAEEASRHGYDLLLATNPNDIADLNDYYITSKRADGLIVIGQGRNDIRLDALADANAPLIVWGAEVKDHNYPTVGSDNRMGGLDATKLLLNQGFKKIAFLGDVRHPEVRHRCEGYQKALTDAGLDIDHSLIIPSDFSRSDGYKQTSDVLLGEGRDFDAIFAASDTIALGAMKRLIEAEKSLPEDVAIVGFDDSPLAGFSTPGLTTVHQDIRSGGQQLVRQLLERMDGKDVGHTILPTRLVVRQSCGSD
jgi:DNA-binding LacI/PurR family transcriptional regulator